MRAAARHLPVSAFGKRRARLLAWQERVRNPTLSLLLVLQILLLFVALPLGVMGVPIAEPVGQSLLLLLLTLVVILSHRGIAIATMILGLIATIASVAFGRDWPPSAASILNHGGVLRRAMREPPKVDRSSRLALAHAAAAL